MAAYSYALVFILKQLTSWKATGVGCRLTRGDTLVHDDKQVASSYSIHFITNLI